MAGMAKLKSVRLEVRMDGLSKGPETSSSGVHAWMEERVFDPLRQINHLEIFEVTVNWYQSRDFVLGYVPFRLKRDDGLEAWSEIERARQRRVFL